MKKLILAAALGATMLGGVACAQTSSETTAAANNAAAAATENAPTPPTRHRGMHGRGMGVRAIVQADLNHDGVITRAEATAAADQRFAAIDTNGDGTVTRDERRAGKMDHRAAWREQAGKDAPRVGREQTRARFRDRALAMFDRVDTNHNGQVDKNEIDAARLTMRARMADRRGGDMPSPADTSDDQ